MWDHTLFRLLICCKHDRVLKRECDRVSFETLFKFADNELISFSELRFLSKPQIEERLLKCGLRPIAIHGGWHKQLFDARILMISLPHRGRVGICLTMANFENHQLHNNWKATW